MNTNLDARRAALRDAEGVMIDGPRIAAPGARIDASDLAQMLTDAMRASRIPRLTLLANAVREAPVVDLLIALAPMADAIARHYARSIPETAAESPTTSRD
ncbi:hypothetical protein LA345_39200 (plasmid) [Burkholderia vietnamiensis]|uniref:Uncharacterized protein n=1 Tax=Burkholderia vietnamiensis (strain G4 / LMG 22486) TaxID=269482 RepID=A4JW88_BURVG|nr:hypothetical protein Bcep1808_7671 [Burkholderia vietnamiensis G4]MCB4349828.1 hypothetical protein [Burkholderia vietnamiensis]